MPNINYFVWKMRQRETDESGEFAIFLARARDVLSWATIKKVGEDPEGTQRVVKTTRVNAIKRFFANDSRNTIPTAIVVAFNANSSVFHPLPNGVLNECIPTDVTNSIGTQIELGTLSFNYTPASGNDLGSFPAIIVDGQHRLKGMAALEENLPVIVVALLNATPEEQAFQFVVINNKSAKVSTDNVKAIIANFDEDQIRERLARAGVDYKGVPASLYDIDSRPDSPFVNLLDWPNNQLGQRIIKLTTIESCLRYIKNKIPNLLEEDDDDTVKEIFLAIWRSAKNHYTNLWPANDKFMSKVNINALNEFVVDRIENSSLDGNVNVYDPDDVERYTQAVLRTIPEDFWRNDWQISLQDNAVVRNMIKADLKTITHNMRSTRSDRVWYQGLELIQPASIDSEENN